LARGRRPNVEEVVLWQVRIKAGLAAEVEKLLVDPVRSQTRYGGHSGLVNKLLSDWLSDGQTGLSTIELNRTIDELKAQLAAKDKELKAVKVELYNRLYEKENKEDGRNDQSTAVECGA
jgi:hypothetical protein